MTMGASCRYPVVLVHGLALRDEQRLIPPWGRIPQALERAGCRVLFGGTDAWNSHAASAALLKTQVERILAETGAEKVNLLAHSKGGLEARYMISHLGMAPAVASLTTVCTPHRGTCVADIAAGLISGEGSLLSKAVDFLARLAGDASPNSSAAIAELTRPYMQEFNRAVPDLPGVCYRSYGTVMKGPFDDLFMAVAFEVMAHNEGPNDGVVAAESCRWGDFRGFFPAGDAPHGISHINMVDVRQRDVPGVAIPALWVSMVEELKALGF